MENKKTTELIDLLYSLINKDGDIKDQDKYDRVFVELKSREPFWSILDDDFEESIPGILETIQGLKDEIKLLKRHKHDERTNDVMVRI